MTVEYFDKYSTGIENFRVEMADTGSKSRWYVRNVCLKKKNDWGQIKTAPTWNDIHNLIHAILECEKRNKFPPKLKQINQIINILKEYGYKDKLDYLFDCQMKFQKQYDARCFSKDIIEKTSYIKDMSLALIDEVMEIIRETPWKPWKKQQTFNQDKIKSELIDAWHFIINLSLAAGLSSNELIKEYNKKHKINYSRQMKGY